MTTTKIWFELPSAYSKYKKIVGDKTVAMVGYGNQGRSQALNLRDSGFNVIVGNIKDDYRPIAKKDGFKVYDIPEASKKADIVFLLIPDEVQQEVYNTKIGPYLDDGDTVVFASGFNYYSKLIRPRKSINVFLVSPKMVGVKMRERYLRGQGFPSLVSVGQSAGRDALKLLTILADGIGVFRPEGCMIQSSFREETLLNLLGEQTWAGGMLATYRAYYDVATSLGCSPEATIIEAYASGELSEIGQLIADYGLYKQLRFHSTTSRYGHLTRGPLYVTEETKELMRKVANGILDGTFAREWMKEGEGGNKLSHELYRKATDVPMEREEEKLYKILGKPGAKIKGDPLLWGTRR